MGTITPNGKAVTVKKTFQRKTSVSISIQADTAIIWTLLTSASDYPRWNTAILGIEGTIGAGEKIKLRASLDPKRTFKLKVKEFQPEQKLVWGDAMGSREFTLLHNGKDAVVFTMEEKIGGPLFPLFARMIPPFDRSFEQFAASLKKEAETIMNHK